MAIPSKIIAYSNCDHAIIAWRYEANIPNCIGFAIFKKLSKETDASAEPIPNHVGFQGQDATPGEQRPSTEWPIQRFTWTDYDVHPGDVITYFVLPMLWNGTAVIKDPANQSGWSNAVTIGTGEDFQAFFNRGIISAQFMSRQIDNLKATDMQASLADTLKDPTSTIRKFLGGALTERLYSEMDTVIHDPSLSIYAALYELNEETFIEKLKEINERANIILANGAFQNKPNNDENGTEREDIRSTSKINLIDRIVTGKHFAHNKFIVFCKNGEPYKVWTGSTNTTENGFFTQVNNAVIINDKDIATWYFNEWNQLKAAGNDYPQDYITNNSKGNPPKNGVTTWFAPVNNQQDMNPARELIKNAKQGILFLFFNPGVKDTLYDAIIEKYTASDSSSFFVHGIINQDPGGKVAPLVFMHKGSPESTNFDTIIPKAINEQFAFWATELKPKMVTIHSKVVVIDPFGDNPVVMTGSHNMGVKASQFNDDNLNIIQGHKALAKEYAVNVLSIYDHFHWRYTLANLKNKTAVFKGLTTDVNWMPGYLKDTHLAELKFFLG